MHPNPDGFIFSKTFLAITRHGTLSRLFPSKQGGNHRRFKHPPATSALPNTGIEEGPQPRREGVKPHEQRMSYKINGLS
jgi:hypothetical protein